MTIDEAIEFLAPFSDMRTGLLNKDFTDALKLGIEALKAIQLVKEYPLLGCITKLPGETKD